MYYLYNFMLSDISVCRGIDETKAAIHDNLLPIGIACCRRDEVYHGPRNFLRAAHVREMSIVSELDSERRTYVPARFAGTGCNPKAMASGPSLARRVEVIPESYTPGATPQTRMGRFLSVNSAAITFVRWDAAALELL